MNETSLARAAVRWGQAIGYEKAFMALMKMGFSSSRAEKILSGRYEHKLRNDEQSKKLRRRLLKDGIAVGAAKAS